MDVSNLNIDNLVLINSYSTDLIVPIEDQEYVLDNKGGSGEIDFEKYFRVPGVTDHASLVSFSKTEKAIRRTLK